MTKVQAEYEFKKRDNTPLKLYVEGVQKNFYGRLVWLQLDRIVFAYNRDEGRFPVKITNKLDVQIFERPEFSNYIGVYASSRLASALFDSMTYVMRDTTGKITLPFFECIFLLKEKEQELRKVFDNMTEISIDKVRDSYVRKATFKGKYLGESAEYQKYVKDKDVGGDVEFFGVSVDERSVILVSSGVIYTRQGSDREESLRTVSLCVENLQKANALRSLSSTLD